MTPLRKRNIGRGASLIEISVTDFVLSEVQSAVIATKTGVCS